MLYLAHQALTTASIFRQTARLASPAGLGTCAPDLQHRAWWSNAHLDTSAAQAHPCRPSARLDGIGLLSEGTELMDGGLALT